MPDLREHVRKTLARTEPSEREARTDLQAVLARRRSPRRYLYPAFAGAALAAVLLLILTRRPPKPIVPPPTPVAGVHLYLRVEGEPPEKALAFDLTPTGEH
jgi:hypothetical protein